MNIYLVLDNRYGGTLWTEDCKAFLERNDAKRYLHELMTSDEIRSSFVPIPPDVDSLPDETGPFIIKEVWMECKS